MLVPPLACPPGYQASSLCAHQVGYFARHLVRLARNRRVDVAWVPGGHARSVGLMRGVGDPLGCPWSRGPYILCTPVPKEAEVLAVLLYFWVQMRANRARNSAVRSDFAPVSPAGSEAPGGTAQFPPVTGAQATVARRRLAYQTSPAVAAAAPMAAAATSAGRGGTDRAGRRCLRRTGRWKSRIGHSRARASRRSARSGFTACGCPTASSIGTSVTESL